MSSSSTGQWSLYTQVLYTLYTGTAMVPSQSKPQEVTVHNVKVCSSKTTATQISQHGSMATQTRQTMVNVVATQHTHMTVIIPALSLGNAALYWEWRCRWFYPVMGTPHRNDHQTSTQPVKSNHTKEIRPSDGAGKARKARESIPRHTIETILVSAYQFEFSFMGLASPCPRKTAMTWTSPPHHNH